MNTTTQLSQLGEILAHSLQQIDHYEQQLSAQRERTTVHVSTVGSKLTTAYEQLRNASEYAEDNLLRQRAVRRFLVRNLSFHEKTDTKQLADELVTELTQAEYLVNDSLSPRDVTRISQQIKRYYGAYWHYRQIEPAAPARDTFRDWLLDVLSVRIEQVFHSNIRQVLFTQFAFTYLYAQLKDAALLQPGDQIDPADMPLAIYIAIHKALLKSDVPTIRTALIDSYHQDVTFLHNFEAFNQKIDTIIDTKTVAYITRIISKNGAPLRIIYSGFYSENAPLTLQSLRSEDTLDYGLRQHIEHEYTSLNRRLDAGIIKSIIFLLITKSIIGLSVEVPYDVAVEGKILWVPLLLNLFFPALFIAFSRLTLSTPGSRNTDALTTQISALLYGHDTQVVTLKIPKKTSSAGFNTAYVLMFLLIFAGLSWLLHALHFNIVQGVIFFVFLSTASFLAFRLSNQVRELETVAASQSSLSLMRDILYLPFIYVGQQISYRYAKMNIVATILDMIIELPLKTVLRLIRQWTVFLNSKKDELV